MIVDLDNLVARAGLGLEAEDRLLLGSRLVRGEQGGLIRLFNERYYQFIVWRSLSPTWNASVEHNRHDLVIFDEDGRYAAVFEMKSYGSEKGFRELPGIREDIKKLRECESPIRGIMIFSANPRKSTQSAMVFLEERIPELSDDKRRLYIFDSINHIGDEIEFWLGLWIL